MSPADLLAQLCRRHQVDPQQAHQLLPLVQWALEGPKSSQASILDLIERTLAGTPPSEAEGRALLQRAADQALLMQVGRRFERQSWQDDERGA
jgi:hypothetical protein